MRAFLAALLNQAVLKARVKGFFSTAQCSTKSYLCHVLRIGFGAFLAVPPMSVSEEMHQRAREEQQVRQNAEHMRSVLGEKKEACNEQEADKYPVANRRRRAAVGKMVI